MERRLWLNERENLMSTTYQELLQQLVPRPIASARAYKRALSQIERLMSKAKKTRAEDDMIALLATLIEQYEIRQGYAEPAVPPRDRLAGLIEARQITQTQLSRQSGVPRTTINEILAGKRGISKVNAARLAKFFGLRIEEFIADAQLSSGI
jgi:antitoxin component HigA of HigAB toxin-antitoxin module